MRLALDASQGAQNLSTTQQFYSTSSIGLVPLVIATGRCDRGSPGKYCDANTVDARISSGATGTAPSSPAVVLGVMRSKPSFCSVLNACSWRALPTFGPGVKAAFHTTASFGPSEAVIGCKAPIDPMGVWLATVAL